MSSIAVIGTGYVGLTTGACFAHLGHDVVCADIIPEKIERLNRGEIPIVEAGLENLVADGLRSGRLLPQLTICRANTGCWRRYIRCSIERRGRTSSVRIPALSERLST